MKTKTVVITEDQIVVERQALLDIVLAIDIGVHVNRVPDAMDKLREPFFPEEISTGESRKDFSLNTYS